MAEAAKKAGVKHVIWSTLEDSRKWVPLEDDRMPTLMDKYKVPHFDAKGESNAYFENSGIPYTLLRTSFYWDNFIYFGMGPQKGPDGKQAITMPLQDKKLPGIAAEDIGKTAYGIFKAGKKYQNKTVGITGGTLTGKEMADGFSEVLGTEFLYNNVPASVYRGFGFPGADDLGNMFQFKADFNDKYCANRDIDLTRELNPELLSYPDWLNKNKDKLKSNSGKNWKAGQELLTAFQFKLHSLKKHLKMILPKTFPIQNTSFIVFIKTSNNFVFTMGQRQITS